MGTFESVLQGLSPQAITDAASRFTKGDVRGQSMTFAPSIAEFVAEARKRQEYLELLARPKLAIPQRFIRDPTPDEKLRVGFKMKVLTESRNHPEGPDKVAQANERGLRDMIELGQAWGIPVPDALWSQLEK